MSTLYPTVLAAIQSRGMSWAVADDLADAVVAAIPEPPFAAISELQGRLGRWHSDKWGRPSRTFMAAKLAEEVGEVCEAAVKDEQGHPRADQLDYGAELADVVIVAICAASIHGVDLAGEIGRKVAALDPVGGDA